jgi:ATP-dependent Clp protease ATP-binding subunit ClpC
MFDRLTDRARKVMGLALKEAQRHRHDYIGTEHILLGIVLEGSGVGASVLKSLDVDLATAREDVEKLLSLGPEVPTSPQLPFTARATLVLERALEEASNFGHTYLGTEHLLLGLIRENEGVAAQVLRNLKVKIEDVRDEVLELLGAEPAEGGAASLERAGPPSSVPVLGLTPAAWNVLDVARAEAVARHADRIDATHLALAVLVSDQGILARALETLGIPPGPVRARLRQLLDEGDARPAGP